MTTNNIQSNCTPFQYSQEQFLVDEICPKLCQYINNYFELVNSPNFSATQGSANNSNLISVINEIRIRVNMIVDFFNISQFQAIGYLYDNCTQLSGLSYVQGCKIRANTSNMWVDILGQAPSTQAGVLIPLLTPPTPIADVVELTTEDISNRPDTNGNMLNANVTDDNVVYVSNTNIGINRNLNLNRR